MCVNQVWEITFFYKLSCLFLLYGYLLCVLCVSLQTAERHNASEWLWCQHEDLTGEMTTHWKHSNLVIFVSMCWVNVQPLFMIILIIKCLIYIIFCKFILHESNQVYFFLFTNQHYPPVDVQVLLSKATELVEGGELPPAEPTSPDPSSWPQNRLPPLAHPLPASVSQILKAPQLNYQELCSIECGIILTWGIAYTLCT